MIDIAGNEIHEGAILKVYHFTGSRKRKHYMYKQVGPLLENNLRHVFHLPILKPNYGYYLKDDLTLNDSMVVACECRFHIYNNLKTKKGCQTNL